MRNLAWARGLSSGRLWAGLLVKVRQALAFHHKEQKELEVFEGNGSGRVKARQPLETRTES
jgi:hypothetical protein